jgi:hypothetical protein
MIIGVTNLRHVLALCAILLLSGCVSERHFAADTLWPFGNPNAPPATSETALRAVGKTPDVAPIAPQAGNVWPGAVQPMPTLSQIQKNSNLPLGEGYTPSLPSPYPAGATPQADTVGGSPMGSSALDSTQSQVAPSAPATMSSPGQMYAPTAPATPAAPSNLP